YLKPEIASNDKTPIWDGHIFVYDKPGRRKQDLIRRVPVQVKGHAESNPGKKTIPHDIPVSDLENYAKEGGVLFIKICVDEEGKNEAYYCGALLKGDIQEILANTRKGVKNKTVWLNRFSVEKAALENFLTGFANAMNENPDGRWEDIAANTPYGVLAADPLPEVVSPLELYRYDSGSVRFVGRDKEMQEIEKFLVSPLPFSWWGIAAPGGAGKSRLAYELKKKLDEEGVWETVLMDRDKMAELPELSSDEFNEKYPGPTLIIVDYAQRYADTLSGWMTRIAENGFGRDQRLRMLLLDRANGETEADAPAWEEEILKSNDGAEYKLLPCRYGEAMLLPRLEDEYLVQIMTDFALRLSERIGGEAELGEDKARELLANLKTRYGGQLKRPLFAMMSADLFMHGEWSEADWSLEKLLDMPVKRELNLLDGRLGAPSPAVKNAFRDVWRAATVVSSMWDPSIERMKELCPESMERIEKAEEEAGLPEGGLLLRAGLTDADCEDISGMTPDLFGEYMVFDWLREKDHRGLRAAEVGRFYTAVLDGIEIFSSEEF
ncbi:MAG: hypothetical protein J6P98_05310, partial [Clostridia bacterium]|nr:hypothetical protein [Clostridia bacterium]